MNNDELLALYLDGTLSEGQRADFDRLLTTSPAFAEEVREILTIQDMLFEPPLGDERTTAFLRSVEDNLANAVIAAGAATTAGAIATAVGKTALSTSTASTAASTGTVSASTASWASSLLSTVFASTTSMVVSAGIGIATIAGGAAAVNYVMNKNSLEQYTADNQAVSNQATEKQGIEPAERSTSAPQGTPQNAEAQSTPPTASTADHTPDITAQRQADAQNGASAPASEPEQTANAKPREYTARISGGGMQGRYAATIADYEKQLHAKEASNDRTGAAFVEKSLGALLRQAGNAAESRVHLGNASKAAQKLGLQELEGEARAELALLDAAEGKKARAVQGLQEALGILNAAKSTSSTRWQKELEKLNGK